MKINRKITIIGGGHMGCALARGLTLNKSMLSGAVTVSDPTLSKIAELRKHGIKVTTNNLEAVSRADIVVLAVKPSSVQSLLRDIRDQAKDKLIVSCAAGVSIKTLEKCAHSGQRLVRIMPNVPVMYGQGVVGVFCAGRAKGRDARILKQVFSSLGLVVELEHEKDIDTLTLVSACGPAVVSYMIEILSQYTVQSGIDRREAQKIAMQTFKGTLEHLAHSGVSSSELIASVATKGGVTEEILKSLKAYHFDKSLSQSLQKGRRKIQKISKFISK
jgi:pyrroline-5-carboxylate reductase